MSGWRAGVEDTVVRSLEDYVQLAVELGEKGEVRRAISDKILASHEVVFDNAESVRGLEDFLKNL